MMFVCSSCGAREPATTRASGCACGGLWDLEHEHPPFGLDAVDRGEWSMFRYRAFMGLDDDTAWRSVTMGEGMTPIIDFDDDLALKMDYFMPTLSFKDRGAAVLVAHCVSIGVENVAQDSSGNAGHAVAAYCARAGIGCEIFVPEGTSPKKIDLIRACGATVNVVPGNRDHCAEVCRAKVADEGVYYANHVYNPVFYEGTKTFAYEIYEQLGRVPANILVPVGNGTLFLGLMKGLEDLLHAGLIETMPQIIAVQAQGCDPLLRAAEAGASQPVTVTPEPTLAEGIAIGAPMRGAQILAHARRYGVRFVHAPEDEILRARAALAARGVYCEHTTAANLAAYWQYCRQWGPTPDCLTAMCGAGLKSDH
ncbi:threonine synthase [Propionibacterium ruminifibrarum]|nr:threonine synthase [Propionibacterium ruminifibrarum]